MNTQKRDLRWVGHTVKALLVVVLLILEVVYLNQYVGLIMLTILFGGVLIWNTISFFRYILFLVVSSIFLIPLAWMLHSHFYKWQTIARLPVLYPLANAIEYIIDSEDKDSREERLDELFHKDYREYQRFSVELNSENGEVIYATSPDFDAGDISSISAMSQNGLITLEYKRVNREFLGWSWKDPFSLSGTYANYWQALLKAEVLFYNPPKYTNYLLVHLVVLLIVINVYLHINFRRNFERSRHLLERIKYLNMNDEG